MEHAVKIDRRILRTKQSITKSFLELFSEKDFGEITINDIAERANVNRGTIYLHYADKYDLLDKCIEERINELISLCKNREVDEVNQELIHESKPFFDYLKDNFPFFSSMFSNQRVFVFRDRLQHFISVSLMEKMNKLGNKSDVESELNAQFMASAFIGIVEWWIRHQMPYSTNFMADQVRKLFEKSQIYPNIMKRP
ncbi:TetR/AcrR family transcriptional regulator [Sporolactobacillus laevolacticus]|uniref:TetR family transcriptional regulator n=1 Tax=Sporolactobacillus laevolacticus DSM 442 TaxID=1395513 RepID=V6IX47_9BACL|nr:TetR/AcrR family transcriptional regulator [Sporolactobacillus laevolacticus]EST11938.1 TetR family transcriptional regulator [Sporolactobacillus laevolacticus DSM 442]